ncbi:1,6-dihydroxycyclohexa-2,4-diene-1-carboxylate dehydrogenase [Polaromonas hydrogenivorans]|uniref:1,6-dihydroxycyclohexa-2,4-diene-1-carboxylate dehydrogenase n=1 Tax=Polaromonas hydrogenivorans TaxID=335476 RepID=A0AAU7LXH8_9BURK
MSRVARFAGKVVIVTGAAQGIGRSVALSVAAEGGTVLAVDRAEIINEVLAEITGSGGKAVAFQADLETFAGAQAMVAECLARFNRVDILINNVGGTIWAKPFEHYQVDEIEAEVRRSLFPTLWCCHAALPHMLAQASGAIVNVSSIATRGVNRVPYGAAKGGVNALTACLALETAERGVRVNAVATGGTEAPPRRIPRNTAEQTGQEKVWYQQIVDQTIASSLMKRYGTIDEQVSAILFLASDEASYITGVTLPVGGGDLG